MSYWLSRIAFGLAVLIMLLTVVNASWLADAPLGGIRLIAHRGVAQQFDRAGVGDATCTASRIEQPVHDYLENTTRSTDAARRMGADMVEVDIARTADGKLALFDDATLGCRTDGKGEVRNATLAQLQALDAGHGYSADGGKTFPFRGKRQDRIPSLEEGLAALPATAIMFNFKSNDPAVADLLAAALKASRRDVVKLRDGFYGAAAPVERIKRHFPRAWAWSLEGAEACSRDYLLTGWTSIVPESCRGGTMVIPIADQWAFWGWPNRLISRMEKVGARVIVTGRYESGEPNTGLTLPEQLAKVPSSLKGHLWVEDIWTVGPAFRSHRDIRTNAQKDAAQAGLARRRARME